MIETPTPTTGKRSLKEPLALVANDITRRVRRVPTQAVVVVNNAKNALKDEFGKRSARGKIIFGFVFAVATVTPGGYVALGVWMGGKKAIRKRASRPQRGRSPKALDDNCP